MKVLKTITSSDSGTVVQLGYGIAEDVHQLKIRIFANHNTPCYTEIVVNNSVNDVQFLRDLSNALKDLANSQ